MSETWTTHAVLCQGAGGKHGTTGERGEVPGEIEVALIRDRGKGAK